jgi:hypothetical protein
MMPCVIEAKQGLSFSSRHKPFLVADGSSTSSTSSDFRATANRCHWYDDSAAHAADFDSDIVKCLVFCSAAGFYFLLGNTSCVTLPRHLLLPSGPRLIIVTRTILLHFELEDQFQGKKGIAITIPYLTYLTFCYGLTLRYGKVGYLR